MSHQGQRKLQSVKNSKLSRLVSNRPAEKAVGRALGDFGDPEDIAEAAAFLASSKARCVGIRVKIQKAIFNVSDT